MVFKNMYVLISFIHFMLYGVLTEEISTKSSYILLPCEENFDCNSVNGTCKDNFCMCNNSRNCKLIEHTPINRLGGSCRSNSDCNMDFASCTPHGCGCKEGYVQSENERRCLKAAVSLGDGCEEAIQCYTNMASTGCHGNKCMCQQHMHAHNGTCYKNVGLGEPCVLHGECSLTKYAKCVKEMCQCEENYVEAKSECVLKANGLNSTCVVDVQCQSQLGVGGQCLKGFCRCNESNHFKPSTNKCVQDLLLNEECEKHSDCHQPGGGPSRLECIIGVCKCQSPYTEDNGYCMSSTASISAVFFKSIILFLGTMLLMK